MRWIIAMTIAIMLELILLSPIEGYSFQTGNYSKPTYTVAANMPSHEPAVVVTRLPYSLKYADLFQPRERQIGKTISSNIISLASSTNILTPIPIKTQASLPNAKLSMISSSNMVNLTKNITALNFSNKMAEQMKNITSPSHATSAFNAGNQ
jgi:hypothetical protein